jgi:hypothetical protein
VVHGPVDTMVLPQERQHLTLGMRRRPAAEAFGQRRGGHPPFNTQAQLERMDSTKPWRQGEPRHLTCVGVKKALYSRCPHNDRETRLHVLLGSMELCMC